MPSEYWSPLIYFDELPLSLGLAKTHRNALAVHMDAAERRGCRAFPEVSMIILRGAVAEADDEAGSAEGRAEESEVRPYDFVAPYSLALGAMVDPAAMADWVARMEAAYPHVNGPFGWRDVVQPQSGRVSPHYLAWRPGLIVSSLLARHIRRYLDRYWTAPQQVTLARLYGAVAGPEDVAVTYYAFSARPSRTISSTSRPLASR